jgi:3-phenylpropionate/trans-cinnamate dioxygenase ferredoxin reductase subunit
MSNRHVIVGAGQAAAWAAISMRKSGFAGEILILGDEGWLPYERPLLSKALLTADPQPTPPYIQSGDGYRELAIDVRLHARADGIDIAGQFVELSDGEKIGFDRVLIATGGRPRMPAIPGADKVHCLRTLNDVLPIRRALRPGSRVVCIGAGVIGLEVASSAHRAGADVTVVEVGPSVMGRCVVPEIAGCIDAFHREAGVAIKLECAAIGIETLEDRSLRVVLSDGSAINADLVVAGIGMQRNDHIAHEAGLRVDNGIFVDEYGRTSSEVAFAAGDVAAFHHPHYGRRLRMESWRHAQNHGMHVGRVMCGGDKIYDDVPWFWTDQHGFNIQVAGLPTEAEQTVFRTGSESSQIAFHLSADGTIVAVTTINNARDMRMGQKMVRERWKIDANQAGSAEVPLAALRVG